MVATSWCCGEQQALLEEGQLELCEKQEDPIKQNEQKDGDNDEQQEDLVKEDVREAGGRDGEEPEQAGMLSRITSKIPATVIFLPVLLGCAFPCADVLTDYGQALPTLYQQDNRSTFWVQVFILAASSVCGTVAFVVDHSVWTNLRIDAGLKGAVMLGICIVFPLFPFSVMATAIVAWLVGDIGLLKQCQASLPIIAAGEAMEAFLSFALQSDAYFSDGAQGLLFSLACGLLSLSKIAVEHNTSTKVYWSYKLKSKDAEGLDKHFSILTGPLRGLTQSWWRTLALCVHSLLEIVSGTACIVLFNYLMHEVFSIQMLGCSLAWSVLYGLQVLAFLTVFLQQAPLSVMECLRSAFAAPFFIPLSVLDWSVSIVPSYIVRFTAQAIVLATMCLYQEEKLSGLDARQARMAILAWAACIATSLMWLTWTVLRFCASFSTLQPWQTEAVEEAEAQILTLVGDGMVPVRDMRDIRPAQCGHPAAERLFKKLLTDGISPVEGMLVVGDDGTLRRLSFLASFPAELGQLSPLRELEIKSCRSTSLPSELGHLTSLQGLRISRCSGLSSLPSELGRLTSLQGLDISSCTALSSLPAELGRLTSLQGLKISVCSGLSSLPAELGRLTSLQGVEISSCPRLASLPVELGRLTSLQVLDISSCTALSSLPAELGRLTSLQVLDISGCPLASLPAELGRLTSLQKLEISSCESLSSLPAELGRLTSLRALYIKNCSRLALLPAELGKLTSLQTVKINDRDVLTSLRERWGKRQSSCSDKIPGEEEEEELELKMTR